MGSFGAEFCAMGGPVQTKYKRQVFLAQIEVVRRHHPLVGRIFPVVRVARTLLVIQLADTSHLKLPRKWTSIDYDPSDDPLLQDAVFTSTSILSLLELIHILSRR